MSEITFTSDIDVELLWTNFSDDKPIIAARTSTKGGDATSDSGRGLIRALVRDGHGVPFEHMTMTVRVTAPLFVWPQIQQHRAGVSLSRESGRYRELEPAFYIPDWDRPLKQVGKPMEYKFEEPDDQLTEVTRIDLVRPTPLGALTNCC
jgi:thymidylate synthase (FAD)